MYKKLDCICGHEHFQHMYCRGYALDACWCSCNHYDPAGHNPELENVLCPACRKVRMEKSKDSIYYCVICSFTLFDWQIKELVG